MAPLNVDLCCHHLRCKTGVLAAAALLSAPQRAAASSVHSDGKTATECYQEEAKVLRKEFGNLHSLEAA